MDHNCSIQQLWGGMEILESRRKRLATACSEIQQVINDADGVMASEDAEPLGELCDRYTKVAKEFAAVLLEERIRRSFLGTIDEQSGQSKETGAEKLNHAQKIKSWLRPWNLGFQDQSTQIAAQVICSTSRQYGAYRMNPFGSGIREINKWGDLKEMLTEPRLVDVTSYLYHSPFGRQ